MNNIKKAVSVGSFRPCEACAVYHAHRSLDLKHLWGMHADRKLSDLGIDGLCIENLVEPIAGESLFFSEETIRQRAGEFEP